MSPACRVLIKSPRLSCTDRWLLAVVRSLAASVVRIEGWFLWYDNDALRCGNLNSLYASKGLLLYPNAGRAEVDRHTKETQKEHDMNTVFRTCTENVADAQRTQW